MVGLFDDNFCRNVKKLTFYQYWQNNNLWYIHIFHNYHIK